MLKVLLESRGTRERRSRVGVVSAGVHAALIVGAAVATSRAAPPPPSPVDRLPEVVYRLRPEAARTTSAGARASTASRAAEQERPDRLPTAPPVAEVSGIPPVGVELADPTAAAANAVVAGDPPAGGVPGAGAPAGGVYGPGDRYVEKPVVAVPGSAQPPYPEMLRQAGVDGEVEVEFVVDTTGRAEHGSLTILRSDHELFAAAVRAALPAMRFLPAEAGGRRVRQLVRQTFSFAVRGR